MEPKNGWRFGRYPYNPLVLKTLQSREIDPAQLITRQFNLDQNLDAYVHLGARLKPSAEGIIAA